VLELALPIGPVSLMFELGLEGSFPAPSRPVPKSREGAAEPKFPAIRFCLCRSPEPLNFTGISV